MKQACFDHAGVANAGLIPEDHEFTASDPQMSYFEITDKILFCLKHDTLRSTRDLGSYALPGAESAYPTALCCTLKHQKRVVIGQKPRLGQVFFLMCGEWMRNLMQCHYTSQQTHKCHYDAENLELWESACAVRVEKLKHETWFGMKYSAWGGLNHGLCPELSIHPRTSRPPVTALILKPCQLSLTKP